MQDLRAVKRAFTDPREFWSSPLYRRLAAVVAADPFLITLAAHARSGQIPTFAFFGAVHLLLLGGADHELANYYPSVCGEQAIPGDARAGPALRSFAHEHAEQLRESLQTRLVQTNHVQRAVGLRMALATIADRIAGRPSHLLEIGSSAGLVLRHAAYGYQLGQRAFGDPRSPVYHYALREGEIVEPWSTFATGDTGALDSIAVDSGGRVWAAAGDGVDCYHADGTRLARLALPEPVANLTFGGPRRNDLFIAATSTVFQIRLKVTGMW